MEESYEVTYAPTKDFIPQKRIPREGWAAQDLNLCRYIELLTNHRHEMLFGMGNIRTLRKTKFLRKTN